MLPGEAAKTASQGGFACLLKCNDISDLKINHSAKVSLGRAMKELEFDHTEHSHVAYYKVVPLKAA